jgi:ABC-type Na+ efflux pump permease subunit
MNALRLLPVILSFLLLGAHFYKGGQVALTAFCGAVLLLLFLRRAWVPLVFQVLLGLAAIEWLRTLYLLAAMRIAWNEPWTRLALILLAVALFTALSGLVFRNAALRAHYRVESR